MLCMEFTRVEHTLAPVFDKNSKILILGSMPSPLSRKTGFYYGHPQNRFWKILSAVLDKPLPITNEEKLGFLLSNNIACWDVISSCDIYGASDSSIKNVVFNDFSLIFSVANIRQVFTTGKTAYRLYEKISEKGSVYLPSPSPANCSVPIRDLIERYAVIKEYLR